MASCCGFATAGSRRRRQVHAHRAAALRLQGDLRGPARGGRAHQRARWAPSTPTSRCSPTACGPSASRASPSTSPTATSPRPSASSSSPTRPGHIQYTRNMVTGASTADLALVLIDARKGVLEQSRRHAFLASLLRIPHLVLCVNKMDLVDYVRGARSRRSRPSSATFATKLDVADLTFIPISALHGDNVVDRSREHAVVRGLVAAAPPRGGAHRVATATSSTPASRCSTCSARTTTSTTTTAATPARSPAACFKPGDEVMVLPSGFTVDDRRRSTRSTARSTRRSRRCRSPSASTDDIDISRGDMICRPAQPAARRPGHRRDGLLDDRGSRR